MKYAIIYLAVPLAEEDVMAPPEEADAQALGEAVVQLLPLQGVTLIGTRLTRNNLVAPSVNRIPDLQEGS